jgi:hypothetical protein
MQGVAGAEGEGGWHGGRAGEGEGLVWARAGRRAAPAVVGRIALTAPCQKRLRRWRRRRRGSGGGGGGGGSSSSSSSRRKFASFKGDGAAARRRRGSREAESHSVSRGGPNLRGPGPC